VYASPILDTDELKMAFRARKVSGTLEKQAPGVDIKSFNVWVIYRIKTLEHSMVSFFLILESLKEI